MSHPTRRRWRWTAAAALALTTAVAGCGADAASTDESSADEPYEVLLLAPLSGPLAATGEATQTAFLAAVDVVNANGGIGGRQVVATVQDDKGDPAEVATLVNAAVASDNPPDFIQPGLTSTETVAALPITAAAGILTGGSAAATSFGNAEEFPLFLSATPLNSDAVAATVHKIAAAGYRSMAVLVEDAESGVANIEPYERAAAAAGITLTGTERIPLDAIDATPQLQRLRDGKPDVLVLSMFGPPNKPAMEARRTLGWDVPVWADHKTAATPLAQLLGTELLSEITLVPPAYVVAGSAASNDPALTTALDAIRTQAGGSLTVPFPVYIHAYYPLLIVKYAAEIAGSTEARAIWEARTKLDPAAMPLYKGSSALFTDPGSNFMSFLPQDFEAVRGGPLKDGLIVPS